MLICSSKIRFLSPGHIICHPQVLISPHNAQVSKHVSSIEIFLPLSTRNWYHREHSFSRMSSSNDESQDSSPCPTQNLGWLTKCKDLRHTSQQGPYGWYGIQVAAA